VKIAIVSEHASPLAVIGGTDSGGQNVYVANVSMELARRGHQVDVFTRRDRVDIPTEVNMCHGVRVVHVPAGPAAILPKEQLLPYMGEFASSVIDFSRAEGQRRRGYAIVHANFFMSGLVGLQMKKTLGLPLIVTFHALGKVRRLHQGPNDGFPLERLAIEEALVAQADRVIAECPQDREDIVQLYQGDPLRLATVPCGFDPAEFFPIPRNEARATLGLRRDGIAILQLGRLVPRKGIDNVIRAVAALRRDYGVRAVLYVVGGDAEEPDEVATPEIGRLRRIAREAGVQDCVEFVGQRPRHMLRLYYSACDIFVTTPWYEPFGITPLEAMACARPVIGSEVGGIRSSVVHNKTGLLVPPKDPLALAASLHELVVNEKRRIDFGQAGWARAHKFYTWSGVVRELEAVYTDAVRAGSARPAKRPQIQPMRTPLIMPALRPAPGGAAQRTGRGR
jgi:glycosyltransferase involved in cell wall biosynthesis